MDPDATLSHLLRLRAAIDQALEGAVPVGDDDVYALVGLLDEHDRWMREGRRAPARWARAVASVKLTAPRPRAIRLDVTVPASNDNASRRRRARVRATRTDGQLALPWVG
jgi:hypothetical protein